MTQDGRQERLSWFLALTNVIAGVLFLLAAFGVATVRDGTNVLYLAVGLLCLIAGAAWFLSLRAS